MVNTLQVGFTGDVMLGRNVDEEHQNTTSEAVWGTIADRLRSLDGLVINLECCISSRGDPWTKTYRPFHFRATPDWAISGLNAAGVDVCSLANNHVLDYGEPALIDTLNHLDCAEIAHSGAGRTITEAVAPAVITIKDFTLAVISFTDNTPEYAADESTPGTAYIDIDINNPRTREQVSETLERAEAADPDLLIASLHWGPNMVEEPPITFETFAHWLVDMGVDFVHGHSAHNFQAVEIYDGHPILYDTGDFVDDYAIDPALRNDRSFLFTASLTPSGSFTELRLTPVVISNCRVHIADQTAAHWSRDRMRSLSRPFDTSFSTDEQDLVLTF